MQRRKKREWIWPWQKKDLGPDKPLEEMPHFAVMQLATASCDSTELGKQWRDVMERWHATSDREHLHSAILCAFASNPCTPAQAHHDIFRLGGWVEHMAQTTLESRTPEEVLHDLVNLTWEAVEHRSGYDNPKLGKQNLGYVQTRARDVLAHRSRQLEQHDPQPQPSKNKLVQMPS